MNFNEVLTHFKNTCIVAVNLSSICHFNLKKMIENLKHLNFFYFTSLKSNICPRFFFFPSEKLIKIKD